MSDFGLLRCVQCGDLIAFDENLEGESRERAPAPVDCPTCGMTVAHFVTAGAWTSRAAE